MTAGPRVVRGVVDARGPQGPQTAVAIVGAGACGLVAALLLRDAGIDCVLLERDMAPGGSSALSSGFIPAAGTDVQRQAGVVDSAAAFAADIQAKARGTAAPHLVAAYSEAIAPALQVLQQRHGLQFELLDGFLYPGHRVRRMHAQRQARCELGPGRAQHDEHRRARGELADHDPGRRRPLSHLCHC
jgi:fumarate reductase flavoprotein subunit